MMLSKQPDSPRLSAEDREILFQIMSALDEVGLHLDGADRAYGHYSPWEAIARLETDIHRLATQLSPGFQSRQSDLHDRLATCHNLQDCWGGLKDAVRLALNGNR